jgi:hypothetical protein
MRLHILKLTAFSSSPKMKNGGKEGKLEAL